MSWPDALVRPSCITYVMIYYTRKWSHVCLSSSTSIIHSPNSPNTMRILEKLVCACPRSVDIDVFCWFTSTHGCQNEWAGVKKMRKKNESTRLIILLPRPLCGMYNNKQITFSLIIKMDARYQTYEIHNCQLYMLVCLH